MESKMMLENQRTSLDGTPQVKYDAAGIPTGSAHSPENERTRQIDCPSISAHLINEAKL